MALWDLEIGPASTMSVYSLRICAVSLPRVYLHFNKHSSVSRSGLDLALGVWNTFSLFVVLFDV